MMHKEIIHFLKKSYPNYISGEEISRALKLSRAAIWKYMQELRKEGYEIVAVPHLGYRLVSSPDKLFPHEIQFELGTKTLGQRIIYEDTVGSTMDLAFQLAMKNVAEGTVVCAESQTKGRGRLGRGWVSPKGKGIYFSMILRPKLPPAEVAKLTLLCGVAVSEAIKKMTGLEALIKWPNDLLIGSKKVAGILTELNAEMDRVKFVIVGIGINVNTSAQQLPPEATSLRLVKKLSLSRVMVFQEILREVEKWYLEAQHHGFSKVLKRWKELSLTLGKWVKVSDPSGVFEGEAISIDHDGGLLIRQDSGVVVKKMAGDVIAA